MDNSLMGEIALRCNDINFKDFGKSTYERCFLRASRKVARRYELIQRIYEFDSEIPDYSNLSSDKQTEKLNEEMKLKGSFDVCKLIADKDVDPQAPTPGSDAYLASTQSWYEAFTKEGIFIGTDSIIGIDSGNYLDMIARFIFFSMFFSFFGLMATVAGIRSLSITFGGDIEIAGLTRLI